jgi:uncharacterized coiled-coil DUF342 family protein
VADASAAGLMAGVRTVLEGVDFNELYARWERTKHERDEARAKLQALLYQYDACHAEKDEARAIARRLRISIRTSYREMCAAIEAFDTLSWAKGDDAA